MSVVVRNFSSSEQLVRNVRKGPLCSLRIPQAQISLRIRAGRSRPSFSAYSIKRYCSIYWRTENAQIRWHRCVCWAGPSLLAYNMSPFSTLYITWLLESGPSSLSRLQSKVGRSNTERMNAWDPTSDSLFCVSSLTLSTLGKDLQQTTYWNIFFSYFSQKTVLHFINASLNCIWLIFE